jgi:glycosyltransferase involved in cell wall biosynthesis
LKNFPLTLSAWRALPEPRPELWLFGVEPEVVGEEPGIRYFVAPSDGQISELLAEATVFVQTSSHEGFCLPLLEAMATGCPVICTDAHGNRDFCEDEANCLMAAPTEAAVASAITRLLGDPALRERLSRAGIETAARYGWPGRIDPLEEFYSALGEPRHARPSSESERTAPRGSR